MKKIKDLILMNSLLLTEDEKPEQEKIDGKEDKDWQIKTGAEVEKEHAGTYEEVQKIFKTTGKYPSLEDYCLMIVNDHLKEDPKYYSKLVKFGL
jgi:hypothetical protein